MSKPRPYIYAVIDERLRFWNGTGWTNDRRQRKLFTTSAEAEEPLRRMMLDNIKAKMGNEA